MAAFFTVTFEADRSPEDVRKAMQGHHFCEAALLTVTKKDIQHPDQYYYYGLRGSTMQIYVQRDLMRRIHIDLNVSQNEFIFIEER